jgi:ribose transport system ATP-binding protein
LAIVRAVEGVRKHRSEGGRAGDGLLVLDEPTVFLPRAGRERLFALIREVATSGASVLFVSHYLDEVREVTDRVTVLRDGQVVGTAVTATLGEADLVEMIVGRKLAALEPAGRAAADRALFAAVEDVEGNLADGASLTVHEGEVLGLTGLAGSGFEEIPYLLFGAESAKRGTLTMAGTRHDLARMTPEKAVAAGIALVPADRQRDASIPSLPIVENIAVPAMLSRFFRWFVLRRRQMERAVAKLMRRFDVRPPNPRPLYSSLSGGNQQKAVLAKWFETKPRILLLHEPTQGVDVGARGQIFTLLRDAADGGMAVICASSDYEQLEAICDRVLVLSRGRIYRELVGPEVRKQRIAEQCYDSMRLPGEIATDMDEVLARPGMMNG